MVSQKQVRRSSVLLILSLFFGAFFFSSQASLEIRNKFNSDSSSTSQITTFDSFDSLNSKVSAQWVTPTELGHFNEVPDYENDTTKNIDNIRGVFVSDNIAFIMDDTYGLILVNVTDPTNPTFLGWYSFRAREIFVSGNIAYSSSGNGLNIINVTDPTSPSLLGKYEGIDTRGLYYSENIVYLGFSDHETDDKGMKIINVTDPSTPNLLGEYLGGSNQNYNDIFVLENIAYATGGMNLTIINVTNPNNPQLLGNFESETVEGGPMDVYVSGNIAYVAYDERLKIFNVSDPTSPNLLGSYNNGGRNSGVFVCDDIAYVSDYDHGLEIINVTNPTNPVSLGVFPHGEAAYSVFVSGYLAYIGFGNDGLKIIDVGYDTDSDGLSDEVELNLYKTDPNDTDTDDDGLTDGEEVYTYNTDPTDADTDDDGISDVLDLYPCDTDNDGLTNEDELEVYKTDPNDTDSDDDGLTDGDEVNIYNTKPTDADTDDDGISDAVDLYPCDTDNDGLTNEDELEVYKTDPNDTDSDDDGLTDGEEVTIYNTDPLDSDSDDDSLGDGVEILLGSDPNAWDTDGDGIGDGLEFTTNFGEDSLTEFLPNGYIQMTIQWEDSYVVIVTNSTMLSASFDSKRKELGFHIQGTSGTNAVCNLSIPTDLVDDLNDITVRMDGNHILFTSTQSNNMIHFSFNYSHSEHAFLINLVEITTPVPFPFLVLLGFSILGISIISIVLIYWKATTSKAKILPLSKKRKLIEELSGISITIILELAEIYPGTVSPSKLAKNIEMSKSTISTNLKRLEYLGYIQEIVKLEDHIDARRKMFQLAPKGLEILVHLKKGLDSFISEREKKMGDIPPDMVMAEERSDEL